MPAPDFATEIADLESALASGELTIELNGERTTYRSVREIREALAHFQAKATAASSAGRPSQVTFAAYCRD